MNTSLIITVLAEDRPGLVSALSEVLRTHGANWMESRMSRLAGKFAGLLQVSVADKDALALVDALRAMQNDDLLIQVEQSSADESGKKAAYTDRELLNLELLNLELLGQDRPGIVEDITQQLATLGINIEEMQSEQRVASMSNEILFYAQLTLRLPVTIRPDDVQEKLEAMSDQLMVDLEFS